MVEDLTEQIYKKLFIFTPRLIRGGMELQFFDLAKEHARRGGEVFIYAANGVLGNDFKEFCNLYETETCASIDLSLLSSLLEHDSIVVVSLHPEYVHILPFLAARSKLLVCAHNRAGTFVGWFSDKYLSDLRQIISALYKQRRIAVSASNKTNAIHHANYFELAPGFIKTWHPSIGDSRAPEINAITHIKTIGIISRLSSEKIVLLDAALTVLKAALNSNDSITLLVAGDGPARNEFEARVELSGLMEHVKFIGQTSDPVETCSHFDLTIANGRVAAEAILSGSIVVTVSVQASLSPDARLGPLVRLNNIQQLADDNFVPSQFANSPQSIFIESQTIDLDERMLLQRWISANRSSVVIYDAFLQFFKSIQPRHPSTPLEQLLSATCLTDRWAQEKQIDMLNKSLFDLQNYSNEQAKAVAWHNSQRKYWENIVKNTQFSGRGQD